MKTEELSETAQKLIEYSHNFSNTKPAWSKSDCISGALSQLSDELRDSNGIRTHLALIEVSASTIFNK